MEGCPICTQKFTKYLRKRMTCEICHYTTCTECVKHYFAIKNDSLFTCMNCLEIWNDEFIDTNLSFTFRTTELMKIRGNVLFDREIARLPETQELLPVWKDYISVKKETEELKGKYQELKKERHILREKKRKEKIRVNVNKRSEQERIFYDQYCLKRSIQERMERYLFYGRGNLEDVYRGLSQKPKKTAIDNPKVIQKCKTENCKGFLDVNWKCPVCDTQFCKECHEKINVNTSSEPHICNDDIVLSIKLMKKDTKNCPSCHVPVYRISGCSQMWCTMCHTPFDWNTGKTVKGAIHNPHYFQWMVQSGRRGQEQRNANNIGDMIDENGCRLLNEAFINAFSNKICMSEHERTLCLEMVRIVRHIQNYEIEYIDRTIRSMQDNENDLNRKNRLLYLVGELSETDFKLEISKKEKKISILNEKRLLFDALFNSITFFLFNTYDHFDETSSDEMQKRNKKIDDMITKIKQVINLFNASALKLRDRHKCKMRFIFRRNYYSYIILEKDYGGSNLPPVY